MYKSKYTKHEHDLADPDFIRAPAQGCAPRKPTGLYDRNTRNGWKPKGYLPARIKL